MNKPSSTFFLALWWNREHADSRRIGLWCDSDWQQTSFLPFHRQTIRMSLSEFSSWMLSLMLFTVTRIYLSNNRRKQMFSHGIMGPGSCNPTGMALEVWFAFGGQDKARRSGLVHDSAMWEMWELLLTPVCCQQLNSIHTLSSFSYWGKRYTGIAS